MIEFDPNKPWEERRSKHGGTQARPTAGTGDPETATRRNRRNRSHVQAVTTYPFMASGEWEQSQALVAYRALQAIPASQRASVIDLVAELSPPLAVRLIKNAAASPGQRRAQPISARSLQARMNNLTGLRARLWELRVAYGPDLGPAADRRAFAGLLQVMAREMAAYADAISDSLTDLAEE